MKRVVFTLLSVIMLYPFAMSQNPGTLVGYGAIDDFEQDSVYGSESGEGVYWFKDEENPDVYTLNRTNDGYMEIQCDSAGRSAVGDGYVPFGVSFGDSNGDAEGGDPFFLDLTENPQIRVALTNPSDTMVSIEMQFQDPNDGVAEIHPDHDSTDWGDSENDPINSPTALKIEFHVPGGESVDTTFDLSSDVAPLGWQAESWGCDPDPEQCPVLDYTIAADSIHQILFFVNPAGDGSENDVSFYGVFSGSIQLDHFSVGATSGDSLVGAVPSGIIDNKLSRQLKVYPVPAQDVINVEYPELSGDVEVVLRDITGKIAASANGSLKEAAVDVSGLAPGYYTANVVVDGNIVAVKKVSVQ